MQKDGIQFCDTIEGNKNARKGDQVVMGEQNCGTTERRICAEGAGSEQFQCVVHLLAL
jgi:hypothetical protein